MINLGNILKRAWHILWNYKTLWIFGLLLALTMGGGGSGNGGGGGQQRDYNSSPAANFQNPPDLPSNAPAWLKELRDFGQQTVMPILSHPENHISTLIWLGVILLGICLLLAAVTAFIRYPAETAVMRMVDEYENNGLKVGFRQGWHLGWNRRAFRLWLTDLLLSLPFMLLAGLFAGGVVLAVAAANGQALPGMIVLFLIGIFLFIPAAILIGVWRNLWSRSIALEDWGVWNAGKQSWHLLWQNWRSIGLMWLIMLGIGLGFGIVSFIAFFLLIPVFLMLLIPAGIGAAIPATLVYGLVSLFTAGPLNWLIALLVALPVFCLLVFSPLLFLDGWYQIYEMNVWTLVYREIKKISAEKTSETENAPATKVETVTTADSSSETKAL